MYQAKKSPKTLTLSNNTISNISSIVQVITVRIGLNQKVFHILPFSSKTLKTKTYNVSFIELLISFKMHTKINKMFWYIAFKVFLDLSLWSLLMLSSNMGMITKKLNPLWNKNGLLLVRTTDLWLNSYSFIRDFMMITNHCKNQGYFWFLPIQSKLHIFWLQEC